MDVVVSVIAGVSNLYLCGVNPRIIFSVNNSAYKQLGLDVFIYWLVNEFSSHLRHGRMNGHSQA